MSGKESLENSLPEMEKIPASELSSISIPVEIFAQESENRWQWCQQDKEALVGAGLDWKLAEELPTRASALREAQARWFNHRNSQRAAAKQWQEMSVAGYALRDEIIHAMVYAYRGDESLIDRIREVAKDRSDAELIQGLANLVVLGGENPQPLQSIKFDMAQLDKAAAQCAEMGAVLSAAKTDKLQESEDKLLRDRAYAHLKIAMDEVSACGQYVFWKDEARRRGYCSEYLRKAARRHAAKRRANSEQEAPQVDGSAQNR